MHPNFPLAERRVVALKKDTPPLETPEIFEWLEWVPQWRLEKLQGVNQLVRFYEFADISSAIDFSKLITEMADSANHHPVQQVEGSLVTMRWWSHSIKGLHLNDFIMAARSDELYRNTDPAKCMTRY